MIEITKEPNADSRTANKPITEPELYQATEDHIKHVQDGMKYFSDLLTDAGGNHDHLKIERFKEFFTALTTLEPGDGVKSSEWYKKHITLERHHLNSHVADDVNLVDVFEYITDCVMAGLSRSGSVYDITLPDSVLQKAFYNTIELLKKNVKVVEKPSDDIMDTKI